MCWGDFVTDQTVPVAPAPLLPAAVAFAIPCSCWRSSPPPLQVSAATHCRMLQQVVQRMCLRTHVYSIQGAGSSTDSCSWCSVQDQDLYMRPHHTPNTIRWCQLHSTTARAAIRQSCHSNLTTPVAAGNSNRIGHTLDGRLLWRRFHSSC
jgi:hypothetical protein